MLSREDCAALVTQLTAMTPYVPPLLMRPLAANPAFAVLIAIANGQVTATANPTPMVMEGNQMTATADQ